MFWDLEIELVDRLLAETTSGSLEWRIFVPGMMWTFWQDRLLQLTAFKGELMQLRVLSQSEARAVIWGDAWGLSHKLSDRLAKLVKLLQPELWDAQGLFQPPVRPGEDPMREELKRLLKTNPR